MQITPDEAKRGLIQTQSKIGMDSIEPNHLSGQTKTSTPDEGAQIRKKKKMWIVIGVVAFTLAVALAIILVIVLSQGNTPAPPLDYYNPYTLDPKDIQVFPARITGILRA
jgi:hypothetical protein